MPPKASARGGGVPASAIAAATGAAREFVVPFTSDAHIGLSDLSASGLWYYIAANCGD